MAHVTIEAVTKTYSSRRSRGGGFVAVDDFSLTVQDGEFVSILGPSGCGKSTLLRSIAGFFPIDRGRIQIGNRVVEEPARRVHTAPEDRNVGMVFQSYAVWPHMTVFDNVAYPLRIRGLERRVIEEKTHHALELLTMRGQERKMPSELSGGQQQRVALGRALVMDPAALLLDEPLSNLDSKLRDHMRFELKELQHRLGLTIVYVTHDQDEAMAVSDRIVLMNNGRMQQADRPRTLYRNPANVFSARFMGRSNELRGTLTAVSDGMERGEVTHDESSRDRVATVQLASGESVSVVVSSTADTGTAAATGAAVAPGPVSVVAAGTAAAPGTVTAPAPASVVVGTPPVPGDRVVVVSRYEHVRLTAIEGDADGTAIHDGVPGRVVVSTYLGSYQLCEVDTIAGRIVAHLDEATNVQEGQRVRVRFVRAHLFADHDTHDTHAADVHTNSPIFGIAAPTGGDGAHDHAGTAATVHHGSAASRAPVRET